jgi:hypothetical protein
MVIKYVPGSTPSGSIYISPSVDEMKINPIKLSSSSIYMEKVSPSVSSPSKYKITTFPALSKLRSPIS